MISNWFHLASLVSYDTNKKMVRLRHHEYINEHGGVIFQALYSHTKQVWAADGSHLIRYEFPFIAITPTQFELVAGWTMYDQDIDLLRCFHLRVLDKDDRLLGEWMTNLNSPLSSPKRIYTPTGDDWNG